MSYYESNTEEESEYDNLNTINELSTDSSENEVEVNHVDDIAKMKHLVNLCVKYENEIEKLNTLKKAITVKLQKAKTDLIPYMKKKDIDHINLNEDLGGGKIKYSQSKVYSNFTKKKLVELLNAYFKNEEQAKQVIKFLYDNRECKEVNKVVKTKKFFKRNFKKNI